MISDSVADDGGADSTGGAMDGGVLIPFGTRIDVLFVVDNSGSMAEEQAILAESMASFVDVLEYEGVDADYRIAITTTDNGNPWCAQTPAAGALIASSCRARIDDFMDGDTDASDACHARCDLDVVDILPTPLEAGGEAVPRPWIEAAGGKSNLGNATPVEAAQCAIAQGIVGCGFEQPLESMVKALARMDDEASPSFGFLRDDADLAIFIVTDEADCSHTDESIFLPDGPRTFWSLPDQRAPSSAVCWNAGVACDGEDCVSIELDALGGETTPDGAVLRPVSRYVEQLRAIEAAKQFVAPGKRVVLRVIGGAGLDGSVLYRPSLDQEYQDRFGIGPGCISAVTQAVPPVRMREVAESTAVGNEQVLFSICDSSYAAALDSALDRLVTTEPRSCYPACVGDADPTTPELDANCALTLMQPGGDGTVLADDIPACVDQASLPPDALHCFVPLDAGPHQACGRGLNLGFRFEHAPGTPFPLGSRIVAHCRPSAAAEIDCPERPD